MLSEKPWQPEMVLRLLLGLFASISLGVIIAQGLETSGLQETYGVNTKLVTFLIGTVSFHGMSLVLVNVFIREHQLTWRNAFGFQTPGLTRCLLLAFMVGIFVLPISWSLTHLSTKILTWLDLHAEPQQAVQMLKTSISLGQKIYFAIVAIVIAPFVEEIIFRGIIYPALKQSGFRKFALWGTSLFFAAIHANLMTFIPLTVLAIILTLLYESTDNLLAPILTHSIFNGANFLVLAWKG